MKNWLRPFFFLTLFSSSLLTAGVSYGQLSESQRPVTAKFTEAPAIEEQGENGCDDHRDSNQSKRRVRIEIKQDNEKFEVKIEQKVEEGRQKWRFTGTLEEIRQRLEASVPDELKSRVLDRLPG